MHDDVVVVGAGIIGLVSAFQMRRAGFSVTLLDPSPAMGATFAAAGMIAPYAEIAPGERSNFERQRSALSAWRQLALDLETLTNEGLLIEEEGTLLVGWDASDRRLVEQFAHVAADFGVVASTTTRREMPDAFAALSPRINEGLFIDGDAWIDPDQAVQLLLRALSQLGTTIVREDVERIGAGDSRVWVHAASCDVEARCGLIATGARGVPPGLNVQPRHAVRPVRGFTLRVDGVERSHAPTVRAFVRGRPFYMVNRPGGYAVLGASADERSDGTIEAGELSRMLRDALDLVPSLEGASFRETRSGLRPATTDLEPFFEVLSDSHWAWSSGHYRHGVTLAPAASLEALRFVKGLSTCA